MSDTSIPAGAATPDPGASSRPAPHSPALQKLFEAAAAREARGPEAAASPHPHAWLEADVAPLPDANADAPQLDRGWQGRRPMPAAVIVTLVALAGAAAIWLLIFGG